MWLDLFGNSALSKTTLWNPLCRAINVTCGVCWKATHIRVELHHESIRLSLRQDVFTQARCGLFMGNTDDICGNCYLTRFDAMHKPRITGKSPTKQGPRDRPRHQEGSHRQHKNKR